MELVTRDEWAALLAIASGRRAWTAAATLEAAGHRPATLAALAAGGLIERVELGDGGPSWVLTPWGLYLAGREVAEHWEAVEVVTVRGGARSTSRRPTEVPHYCGPGEATGPIRLPRHADESRLPWPELVIDDAPGPLEEAIAREEVAEPGKLFFMGVEVVIDRRLPPSGTVPGRGLAALLGRPDPPPMMRSSA